MKDSISKHIFIDLDTIIFSRCYPIACFKWGAETDVLPSPSEYNNLNN